MASHCRSVTNILAIAARSGLSRPAVSSVIIWSV
jgi:hypothetical protein